MVGKKFSAPKLVVKKVVAAPALGDMPTHPVQHNATQPKEPLAAEDPQILEQALLKRMNRFG